MSDWEFAHIEFLWALAVIPLLVLWYVLKYWNRQAVLGFSSAQFFAGKTGWKSKMHHVLFALLLLNLVDSDHFVVLINHLVNDGVDLITLFDVLLVRHIS